MTKLAVLGAIVAFAWLSGLTFYVVRKDSRLALRIPPLGPRADAER